MTDNLRIPGFSEYSPEDIEELSQDLAALRARCEAAKVERDALRIREDLHIRWMRVVAGLCCDYDISGYEDLPGKWDTLMRAKLDEWKARAEKANAKLARVREYAADAIKAEEILSEYIGEPRLIGKGLLAILEEEPT